MVADNREERRNQIWRATMGITTVLIIIIAAFFIIKLFTVNPLEGKWIHGDSGLIITIKGNSIVIVKWSEESESEAPSVEMKYSMEKAAKSITLQADDKSLRKAVKKWNKGDMPKRLQSTVSQLEGVYHYSIEKQQLTLSDGEYGEQMVFDKGNP